MDVQCRAVPAVVAVDDGLFADGVAHLAASSRFQVEAMTTSEQYAQQPVEPNSDEKPCGPSKSCVRPLPSDSTSGVL